MKKLLVICNGPSTKNLDWNFLNKNKDKIDTFCVNNIYRKFKDLNFYTIAGKFHEQNFQKMVNDKTNKIKQFYFLNNIKLTDKTNRVKTITIKKTKEKYISTNLNMFNDWLNSGVNALQIGCMLGYKEIYIIGVDGYKVEKLKETINCSSNTLKILKTPNKNPNYFLDDYQQEGDIYQKINQNTNHKPGWEIAGKITKENNIKVYNMGNRDYIKCFEFIDLNSFYNSSLLST
jgi:hypothetical protein